MLEGRVEILHCGTMCFTVFGRDEVLSGFVEYLNNSAHTSFDVRVIAGRDHLGRIKIAITGSIVEQFSIELFRYQFIDDYCSR